jgi:hypothetical protein
MFTHPTANQLSDIAVDNYHFHPDDVGRLSVFIAPSALKAGDCIEATDGWNMVTMYNQDGFREVFVAEPKDGEWKHIWMMFPKEAENPRDEYGEENGVRCVRREVAHKHMDPALRILPDMLPPRPTFIGSHACTGLNQCCQKERARA